MELQAPNVKLIHYGAKNYDPKLVSPIKNSWVKPEGGLWTSPINSEYGWKDWCTMEDFRECTEDNSFVIELYDWAKVYVIDDLEDLLALPFTTFFEGEYLDFEWLAKEYDAVWLTNKGEVKTRWTKPALYGWDCESVLILNPECCFQVPHPVEEKVSA